VTLWSDQTNTTANTLLSPTDWMVVREVDNGKVMPSGVKEWRQEVRYACEDKISVLTLTKTTDELANYVTYTSPSGGATTDYNYWPQLNSTPVPSGSYSSSVAGATMLGGDDTLSFSSNSTSASIGSL